MCKFKILIPVLAVAAVLCSHAAMAQYRSYGVQQPGGPGAPHGRPVRNPPSPPQQFQPPARPHGSQLSEEQRRQLHRDLDKANREIYGAPRPR